ncbi:MAG: hypothetical protein AAGC81_07405 [Pseudomonadota bacterium]
MRILMLGSGPNAVDCQDWPREPFDRIVAINNAWRVRNDWDDLVYPEDFPIDRRPETIKPGQQIVEADRFIPMGNRYGGVVWCGATMAFTATYWALGAFTPSVIAYLGCDMVYEGSRTHFYGNGSPDPLRDDITLRSLEAKAARAYLLAREQNCALVNLSTDDSRLVFPRATRETIASIRSGEHHSTATKNLLSEESAFGYEAPTGRYWESLSQYDPEIIDAIDAKWLSLFDQRMPISA